MAASFPKGFSLSLNQQALVMPPEAILDNRETWLEQWNTLVVQ